MTEDDNVDKLPVGKTPADTVANQLLEAQKKKKQEEFKKAMTEVTAAAEVFFNAVDKAEALSQEIGELKKVDFGALRKALNF